MIRTNSRVLLTTIFVTAGDGRHYLQGPVGNYVRIEQN